MKKMNSRGFTLVELLAVIVVLAIIMVFAVPAIMGTMNNAKKSAFKAYANKVLNLAAAKYEGDNMMNTLPAALAGTITGATRAYCYTLSELELTTTGGYTGYAIVALDANAKPTYYVTLRDNSFSVENRSYSALEKVDTYGVGNTTAAACPTGTGAITVTAN